MRAAQRDELIAAVHQAVLARGGRQHGDEWRFPCPEPDRHKNGDRDPSADWNPKKAVWCCRVCGARGGVIDLAKRLGINLGTRRDSVRPPSLVEFAQARRLPVELLKDTFGVRAVVHQGRPALRYPTTLGVDRLKYLDRAKPKYTWATKGAGPHWYNLDRALELLHAGAPT